MVGMQQRATRRRSHLVAGQGCSGAAVRNGGGCRSTYPMPPCCQPLTSAPHRMMLKACGPNSLELPKSCSSRLANGLHCQRNGRAEFLCVPFAMQTCRCMGKEAVLVTRLGTSLLRVGECQSVRWCGTGGRCSCRQWPQLPSVATAAVSGHSCRPWPQLPSVATAAVSGHSFRQWPQLPSVATAAVGFGTDRES